MEIDCKSVDRRGAASAIATADAALHNDCAALAGAIPLCDNADIAARRGCTVLSFNFTQEGLPMTRFATKTSLSLAALAASLVLAGAPALALNTRSFISNGGNDASSCINIPNACSTIEGALAKTNAGGEISVVNTSDYGIATITTAISITNDGGGEAGIITGAHNIGIDIIAGNGDVVTLRGLNIDGQAVGRSGISIHTANAVHIQNAVIRNMEEAGAGTGIGIVPTANVQVFIADSFIFNNGSVAATGGIVIKPGFAGHANVTLDRVHLENNVRGIWADGTGAGVGFGSHVVIRESFVTGNAGDGVLAISTAAAGAAFIVLERSTITQNAGAGVHADGGHAVILLSDNTISRNGTGVSATTTGQVITYGNNRNNNNIGAEGVATSTFSSF